MALYGKLNIEGREYIIKKCDYEFSQAVDITGRPSDRPRGGLIHVVIMAPDDRDLSLHEWMRDKDTTKEGEINLIVNRDYKFSTKHIKFKNAYCIGLKEIFDSTHAEPMYATLTIMAGSLLFGDECEFKMID